MFRSLLCSRWYHSLPAHSMVLRKRTLRIEGWRTDELFLSRCLGSWWERFRRSVFSTSFSCPNLAKRMYLWSYFVPASFNGIIYSFQMACSCGTNSIRYSFSVFLAFRWPIRGSFVAWIRLSIPNFSNIMHRRSPFLVRTLGISTGRSSKCR